MRKSSKWSAAALLFAWSATVLIAADTPAPADNPPASYTALSDALVARARSEVSRIQPLVADGTLPKTRLDEALDHLADAEDQAILGRTLYGVTHIEDLTPADASAMVEAAQRRVDRQQKLVDSRQVLLDKGILAKSEITSCTEELESRKRVLELAKNRLELLNDLRQMAAAEQRFEQAAQDAASAAKKVMIRYDGNGVFDLSDLPIISSEFQKEFHRPLPVSALGQTALHESMGLDHRNRVDVALNPDSKEGMWLRGFLEQLHIPFLAFRAAVAGAATAPHIHIGPGSTRLKLASASKPLTRG